MKLILGDSLQKLKDLPSNTVDACVTDPPYGLSFMGKKWDYDVPSEDLWREVYRVMKPGAHLLSFFGTRTYHAGVTRIEAAGFRIKDMISWNYGQGFPKSLNVNKSCSKMGAICECETIPEHSLRPMRNADLSKAVQSEETIGQVLQSCVPEQGASGAVLRPESQKGFAAREKSSMEGRCDVQADEGQLHRPEVCPVSASVHGDGKKRRLRNGAQTGDGETNRSDFESDGSGASPGSRHKKQSPEQSRALADERQSQSSGAWPRCSGCGKPILPEGLGTALKPALEPIVLAQKPIEHGLSISQNVLKWNTGALAIDACRIATDDKLSIGAGKSLTFKQASLGTNPGAQHAAGRWPANVLFDEPAAQALDAQSGVSGPKTGRTGKRGGKGFGMFDDAKSAQHSGAWPADPGGGASRFFYVAKASRKERNAGLEGMPDVTLARSGGAQAAAERGEHYDNGDGSFNRTITCKNNHPTVKPIKLMEYLCKLITPPGGIILDPFMGSGTTGCAAVKLGYQFIGIEREAEYIEIARRRIEYWRDSKAKEIEQGTLDLEA